MKLKVSIFILSTVIAQSALAFVPYPKITPSVVSALSVASVLAIPLSPLASVYVALESSAKSNKPLKVTNVRKDNEGTVIRGVAENKEPVEIRINSTTAEAAKVEVNTDINVLKTNMGFVLEANKVSLGVVSDKQENFNREMLSK